MGKWVQPTFSAIVAEPKDSPRHRMFRDELWLVGPWHACRYYVTVLKARDLFALDLDAFLAEIRLYATEIAGPAPAACCNDLDGLTHLEPLLRDKLAAAEGAAPMRPLRRDEKAMIVLLRNPAWSETQIAEAVGTTVKHLARSSRFQALVRTLKKTRAPKIDTVNAP